MEMLKQILQLKKQETWINYTNNIIMSNRRSFIKKAGLGIAGVGLIGCGNPQINVEKSEDGYTSGAVVKGGRTIEKVTLKVTTPLFLPYHSLSTAAEKGTG